jgi:hypothetical protein
VSITYNGEKPRVQRNPATKYFILGASIFALIVIAVLGGSLFEGVNASEIVVVQHIDGTLSWYTQSGWAWQGFGKVTRYPKRGIITFQPPTEKDGPDGRLPIVFNDAGKASMKGSMNYELPTNEKQLVELHSFYSDRESLEAGLIKPALNKSVYLTGTLMTSYESYKEKRSMLIQYIEDQTQNGVYRTRTVDREVEEETIGTDGQPKTDKKRITEVEIERDRTNQQVRAETGQLSRFGVRAFNFAIEDLTYDTTVTEQIKQQQGITMAVQTSIAKAKQAIQDAVTAEATGRANVATTRAAEEVEKTKAVVQGEKMRDVAALKAQEAESYKKEQLLRAEADSEYRKKIIAADNALNQRLDAYKYAVDRISTAIEKHQGSWVPGVVVGGSANGAAGGGVSSVQALMDLLLVNQAKAAGVNLSAGN